MLPLPRTPESPNIEALARVERERITGVTGVTLTLEEPAVEGVELVYKNGALLDPAGGAGGYAIDGRTITLGAAAIAGDVFVIKYHSRGAV